MKLTTKLIAMFIILLTAGCINFYTRNPITDARIEDCYQSTEWALTASLALSFPQMVKVSGNSEGFQWYNCLTIPFLGLPCTVDAVCEGVLDTVFYPADYFIVEKRHPSKKEDALVEGSIK